MRFLGLRCRRLQTSKRLFSFILHNKQLQRMIADEYARARFMFPNVRLAYHHSERRERMTSELRQQPNLN